MRLDNPLLVRWEYASEERFAKRNAIFHALLDGSNPEQVAYDAVASPVAVVSSCASNVAFLELRYLDADDVDLGHAFDDIAPLLWLRAGGQGPIARRIDDAGAKAPYVWTDHYGVLFDEDRWRSFVSARPESARAAFIVTYSPTVFAGIAAELPTSMDTVRLYDTYLSMFLPERGRA